MIVNFYNGRHDSRLAKLLKTLNIDSCPSVGFYVDINGRKFYIQSVVFNAHRTEYDVYMIPA